MLDKQIVFTYAELIEAFNIWDAIIASGKIPDRPDGNNMGEMLTNFLIEAVNHIRKERLTTYNK